MDLSLLANNTFHLTYHDFLTWINFRKSSISTSSSADKFKMGFLKERISETLDDCRKLGVKIHLFKISPFDIRPNQYYVIQNEDDYLRYGLVDSEHFEDYVKKSWPKDRIYREGDYKYALWMTTSSEYSKPGMLIPSRGVNYEFKVEELRKLILQYYDINGKLVEKTFQLGFEDGASLLDLLQEKKSV